MAKGGNVSTEGKTPGAQQPQKYPTTGPNYAAWGEQSGWAYSPYTDSYHPDKKKYEEYMYSSGQAERPKGPPSLLDTVAPVAAVGGAYALSKGAGEGLSGLFSLGGEEAAKTAVVETAKTSAPAAAEAGGLAMPAFGSVGVLPMAAIAGATYLGGKSAYDMLQGNKDNSLQGKAGRGILGMATGGISEMVRPAFMHESTRDHAQKNTQGLMGIGQDDARYQSYVKGMREQFNSAPTGKAFGQYDTWNEAKAAGLQADGLTGVYGNIKAYGPAWAGLTFDQQKAVTQLNINDGLYDSKKGEVILTNDQKAQENLAKVVKPQTPLKIEGPVNQPKPSFAR